MFHILQYFSKRKKKQRLKSEAYILIFIRNEYLWFVQQRYFMEIHRMRKIISTNPLLYKNNALH